MDAMECARAASMLRYLGDAALCSSQEGEVLACNGAATSLLGYDARELVGRPLANLFAEDGACDAVVAFSPGNAASPRDHACVGLCRDGRRVLLSVSCSTWRDPESQRDGHLLLLRTAVRRRLRLPPTPLWEAIVRSSADAIVTHDLRGAITSWNRSAERLYGYRAEEVLGRPILLLWPAAHHDEQAELLARIRRGGRVCDLETPRLRKDGSQVAISASLAPLEGDGGVLGVCDSARDLGEFRNRTRTLMGWALADPLTGLPNRRALLDRLGVAMRKGERTGCPGALLFIDLDDFKQVNDRGGHAAGDAVLVEVANRIRALVRDADTAARIGGDEFVVLLEALDRDPSIALVQAETLAGKLLAALEAMPSHGPVRCSASVGVTLFSGLSLSHEQLLSRADGAMYAAKSAGKNRVRVVQALELGTARA